ncbi:MAG TPA: RNA polymerase sigma factor [Candidatus Hydrogenedentes bacterium]|nr:RNA polymerase sigma factor [Candidatus Hydrogenedentota bacterium]
MLVRRDVSDRRLIRQVLAGRRESFGVLVERYLHVVHALAYAQTGNHADAEDVVQETFIKAFQSLSSLRDTGRFPAWLTTIARRICYGLQRRAQQQLELQQKALSRDWV